MGGKFYVLKSLVSVWVLAAPHTLHTATREGMPDSHVVFLVKIPLNLLLPPGSYISVSGSTVFGKRVLPDAVARDGEEEEREAEGKRRMCRVEGKM
ncbi:hypothetical protein E2C01_005737 [Portunus trituberculatus]|uniref:Uncharacterized protein n=1 Tax=Portunus trituberculatus TaxID=210409 RepID=A0A5B7CU98_PORTR|nr:hypothetical protein [Portunus trituberculatus]